MTYLYEKLNYIHSIKYLLQTIYKEGLQPEQSECSLFCFVLVSSLCLSSVFSIIIAFPLGEKYICGVGKCPTNFMCTEDTNLMNS